MFNAQRPNLEDLPTARQLIRATLIAAASAGALLVAVILPSEYGVDPTGIGRAFGFTQMGEIKMQLAEEAAADAAADTAAAAGTGPVAVAPPASGAPVAPTAVDAPSASAVADRSDTTSVTLAPGEGAEIKLTAARGARIAFNWTVEGGHVWTAPAVQEVFGIDEHRSGASMCPACSRSTAWLLALMKSADRFPDHVNALG